MKRFVLVGILLLMFALPVLGGHTVVGSWCECGTPHCLCDPGEDPSGGGLARMPGQDRKGLETKDVLSALATGSIPVRIAMRL